MRTILGIDPGQHGGFATIDTDGHLAIWDMKHCYDKLTGYNTMNPLKFSAMVDSAIPDNCDSVTVYCEESLLVHGNGIKTARSVWDSHGVMRAVFSLRGLDVHFIPPKTWKKHFGLLKADKSASVQKAIEIFPMYEDFFRKQYRGRTIDLDGRAEAALVAYFGQQQTNLYKL